jgi:RNA polymerase sigma-70 factor (ECF subfamily)
MLLDGPPDHRFHPARAKGAPIALAGPAAWMKAGRDRRSSRKVELAIVAGPDWVSMMPAVRDHQGREAFAALFRHFAPRLKAFLMKGGMSPAAAEDGAQDVMATLWQKAQVFDRTRASVATWVFAISRNRRIDIARKDRRPEPEDLPWGLDDEPDQADLYMAAEETRALGGALALLPEASGLIAATHVTMCDECRARLAALEAVGGAMIEHHEAAPLSDGALERTLSSLSAPQRRTKAEPRQSAPVRASPRRCSAMSAAIWMR